MAPKSRQLSAASARTDHEPFWVVPTKDISDFVFTKAARFLVPLDQLFREASISTTGTISPPSSILVFYAAQLFCRLLTYSLPSKEKFSCDNWVWLSRWTARSRTHHTRELQERRGLGLSAEMPQCKHIMLACCHDSGYAPFLGQLVADKSIEERITLLIGSPAASPIKQLGFKCVTHFRSVFTCVVSQEGTNKPVQGAQAYSYAVPSHQFARLGPIIAKNGRRVDPPLSVEQQLAERVKRLGLCGWLFLRGECRGCSRNHQHPTLSDEEFDALCVSNDTELRELSTSPSGTISYVTSAASSHLDITASRAFDILGSAPLRFSARPTPAALAAVRNTTGPRILSHWMRPLDTNRWVKTVQSLPGDRGTGRLPRLQSSVLAALGSSPARGFPKDA
ncbi:hypothetical protein FOQG_18869 [Fusarium oxysporum f. sp. raphani 54005]|uniref:DUF7923 domain-containing protein n=1 Tax=Fusarium oxysporum f. sp. raphani 54005 TaxID=1089458 RepID=X0B2P4_FUSOX|nr:hypothetical protein FOQG_18869 [Fusarium oxysporum f. sp. raphani 54005]